MQVAQILKTKGGKVATTSPETTVGDVARMLLDLKIGALIVLGAGGKIVGIISERDIARALAVHGGALPTVRVVELMTRSVVTCTPESAITEIMATMTAKRFRHMPVLENGALVGVVSIGDVVKYRLDELESETAALHDYIRA